MTILLDRGISAIDGMINLNPVGGLSVAHIPREAFRDEESLSSWPSPGIVQYLFRGAGGERLTQSGDPELVVELLNNWGIERAGVIVEGDDAEQRIERLLSAGDRWLFLLRVNPHDGMKALRQIDRLATDYGSVRSVALSPHAYYPPIPPNSREYYPIYAKCVERGLPVWINVGIPGPRVPGWTQDPLYLDEVCWFFPELTVVMKHGGEPWTDMCVKLMLKWPNLYFATSGFSPKHYPKAIIDFANTRGEDKIIFAGYWPFLDYGEIFAQLAQLPLREHVWQKMFSDNIRRVCGLH